MTNIYESGEFSLLKDYSMHPGGLRLTDRAARLAGLKQGMEAADIGCGAGSTAAFLARKYELVMTGADISEHLINTGKTKYPDLTFIHRDCKTLPFKSESLDAVLFECTLSVMDDDFKILDQCICALKPGGKLVLSDLFSKQGTGKPILLPTVKEFEEMLASAGFDLEVSEDHTPALITYAAEMAERFGGTCEAGGLLCNRLRGKFKLSDYCYHLIIARK